MKWDGSMDGLIEAMERAKALIAKLSFDDCIRLYDQLDRGHPMIDLVFDRMEELDAERFEAWL